MTAEYEPDEPGSAPLTSYRSNPVPVPRPPAADVESRTAAFPVVNGPYAPAAPAEPDTSDTARITEPAEPAEIETDEPEESTVDVAPYTPTEPAAATMVGSAAVADVPTDAAAEESAPEVRGATTIADEVVEKVTALAAREVDGVYDLGGDAARVFAAVRDRVGLPEDGETGRGVSVEVVNRNATLHLTLVVEYGHRVLDVADAVRDNVVTTVEKMLGLEVVEVNINVDDVHMPDAAS